MEQLHVRTPLIESVPLSKLSGFKVYLKLENTQPSGSFKLRGLGHHCVKVGIYLCCVSQKYGFHSKQKQHKPFLLLYIANESSHIR